MEPETRRKILKLISKIEKESARREDILYYGTDFDMESIQEKLFVTIDKIEQYTKQLREIVEDS